MQHLFCVKKFGSKVVNRSTSISQLAEFFINILKYRDMTEFLYEYLRYFSIFSTKRSNQNFIINWKFRLRPFDYFTTKFYICLKTSPYEFSFLDPTKKKTLKQSQNNLPNNWTQIFVISANRHPTMLCTFRSM